MKRQQPPTLFVTGTDTDVGKTYVACLIVRWLVERGFRVGTYKPVASGCEIKNGVRVSSDAETLWDASGKHGVLENVCPQRFIAPVSPNVAARMEGDSVDRELLRSGLAYWTQNSDLVVIEGAGGLMSPVTDDEFVADLAFDFGSPLLVVAPNRLGVINQTIQTLISASTFRGGLEVLGVILNDAQAQPADQSLDSNRSELERFCVSPVLAHVRHNEPQTLDTVDWASLLNLNRQ